jgi:hypothetical protein
MKLWRLAVRVRANILDALAHPFKQKPASIDAVDGGERHV